MELEIPGTPLLPDNPPEALNFIESPALRRAARDVVATWPEGPGLPGSRVVASELLRLSQFLTVSGTKQEPVPAFDPDLLDIVRAQLLEQVSEGPQPGEDPVADLETLEVLRSGRVREGLDDSPAEEASRSAKGLDVEQVRNVEGLELAVEMAHDIRSPLSSILFLSDTLRRGHSGEINDVQKRQLGLIYSAALGLAGVVSDVVELAKSGGTLRDERKQRLSVSAVMASVEELVAPMAEEKGLAFTMSPPERDQVKGYPVSLRRVLLNLVTNALNHTETGSVTVSAESVGHTEIEFSVTDTGSGIDGRAQQTLFQPFRSAPEGDRTLFSGTGLGLSIARGLVQAMGGEMGFDTEVGKGTRFWFRLPMPTAST